MRKRARKAAADVSKRANVTMHPRYWTMLKALAGSRGVTPSETLRQLIEQEWERRQNGERNHAPSSTVKSNLHAHDQ